MSWDPVAVLLAARGAAALGLQAQTGGYNTSPLRQLGTCTGAAKFRFGELAWEAEYGSQQDKAGGTAAAVTRATAQAAAVATTVVMSGGTSTSVSNTMTQSGRAAPLSHPGSSHIWPPGAAKFLFGELAREAEHGSPHDKDGSAATAAMRDAAAQAAAVVTTVVMAGATSTV